MTCREVIESIDEDLEAGRSDEDRRRVAEHLATCASCSAYLESYRRAIELAKDASKDASNDAEGAAGIPESLVARILSRRRKG